MAKSVARVASREDARKLDLVRNSALVVELTGDQCGVLSALVTLRVRAGRGKLILGKTRPGYT